MGGVSQRPVLGVEQATQVHADLHVGKRTCEFLDDTGQVQEARAVEEGVGRVGRGMLMRSLMAPRWRERRDSQQRSPAAPASYSSNSSNSMSSITVRWSTPSTPRHSLTLRTSLLAPLVPDP